LDYSAPEYIVTGTDEMNEAQALLDRIGSHRDPEALSELYDHYAPRVYQLGLLAGLSRVEAENIVEEVFYTAWQTAGQYDGKVAVRDWIVATALDAVQSRMIRVPGRLWQGDPRPQLA
jgi:DNA-directed RNA polymerase specialized sigma24 family protein